MRQRSEKVREEEEEQQTNSTTDEQDLPLLDVTHKSVPLPILLIFCSQIPLVSLLLHILTQKQTDSPICWTRPGSITS